MNRNTWTNRVSQATGWVIGSATVVLLLSAGGLTVFAQMALGPDDLATALLVLYLASWSYVVGIVVLVLLLVLEFIGGLRMRMKQTAMTQYSPAEPRPRPIEKPALEDLQYPKSGMAPTVLSRSSVIGIPLIMKEMVEHVQAARSYARVTILIDERADGLHLSYTRMYLRGDLAGYPVRACAGTWDHRGDQCGECHLLPMLSTTNQ